MKKIIVLLLSLILLFSFSAFTLATNEVVLSDNADLLTDSEESQLSNLIKEYSQRNGFNIIILTTETIDGNFPTDTSMLDTDILFKLVSSYCTNYYLSHGFSLNDDGIILIRYINSYDKYIGIVSFGSLIEVFDEYESQEICEEVKGFFDKNSNEKFQGFNEFLALCEETYLSRNDLSFGVVFVALVIALIISLIIVMGMKGKLKSVRMNQYAVNYIKQDSFKLTDSRDIYLYRTVTRTRIQSSSSGGRSGGSRSGGGGTRA